MPGELAGKVCVVTGAAGGMGQAITRLFSSEGGRIAAVDRDRQRLESAGADLRAQGVDVRSYEVDISREDQVVPLARDVERDFGRIDVLINNAGVSHLGPSMSYPLEAWRESLDVMATGVFLCSRELAKPMRAQGSGTIVNISSINATVGFPMRLAYSAAKAAVNAITQGLAIEWAGYGIRVNGIAPGVTDTPMVREAIADGFIDLPAYLKRTPLRRLGRPDDIAQVALFLASPRSGFITGQTIVADGGWSAFGWIPWAGNPQPTPRSRTEG